MKITFIGHAGLAIHVADCTILMDPWLSGSIFNNGWDLLVPSILPETTLGQVTHVWISHEHPDHFHLPSLRTILKAHPNTLTILFQPTADSRVVNWARREGFEVQTLTEHCWVPLTESCRVLLGKVGLYDSWLAVEHGDKRFLNLNDCVFANASQADRVATLVGPVDCLMAQFSYASWMGNPEETAHRATEALARSGRFGDMVNRFRPQSVIPAASFSWFSHGENAYLNDLRVAPGRAAELVRQHGAVPILLAPGDTWLINTPHDNSQALDRYEKAWDVSARPLHRSESVPIDELVKSADQFAARSRKCNNRLLMWILRMPPFRVVAPIELHLIDHLVNLRFDPVSGIGRLDRSVAAPPGTVSLHSSSLLYVLRNDWGVDTLNVSGRYRANLTGPDRLNRAFWFAVLNNAGRYVRWRELLDPRFIAMAVRRIRAALRGDSRSDGRTDSGHPAGQHPT